MNEAPMDQWRRSLPWLVLAASAAAVLVIRLQLSFDLSAFFPQKTTLAHDVLLEQFRTGPGSRLLVIGIDGMPHDALEELSDALKSVLLEDSAFSNALNGEVADDSHAVPEPIQSYFLLMRDVDYSQASIDRAIVARLQDLAFGGGTAMLDLIARDPFLVTLDVLQQLSPVDISGDMWFTKGGTAVLVAETHATAIDISGQQQAVAAIRSAFAKTAAGSGASLDITGVGAFSVEMQEIIRAEATRLSILASVVLLLILFALYRKPRHLLLATVPVGMGFTVGLAVVSLAFDTVHGITLAFGFTLMGVAVDYPVHLFSHARKANPVLAIGRIWPTMRLGAITTAIAYLALMFSGSDGLAQLGLFTATGILVAVIVTRGWLPYLLKSPEVANENGSPVTGSATLRFVPALAMLVIVVPTTAFVTGTEIWDDNLASLSPVPPYRLKTDTELRSATGATNMRYHVMLHNSELESLLEQTEAVDTVLEQASEDGLLAGWQSVTNLLPSHTVQTRRQTAIPGIAATRDMIATATANTPFRDDAFAEFVLAAEQTRTSSMLGIDNFAHSPLASWFDAHLVQVQDQWVSLISLNNPDAGQLQQRLLGSNASLMDLRDESSRLLQDYRQRAMTTIAIASAIILLLLWYQRQQSTQVVWVALTVAAAIATTVAIVIGIHGQLTVIHMVALLLVLGLGLDYALFLGRTESEDERSATRHAVFACALTTTVTFGILAGSDIPVLRFLGLTVAVGSAVCYLLAFAGSRAKIRSAN
jgi:predicted exporter